MSIVQSVKEDFNLWFAKKLTDFSVFFKKICLVNYALQIGEFFSRRRERLALFSLAFLIFFCESDS